MYTRNSPNVKGRKKTRNSPLVGGSDVFTEDGVCLCALEGMFSLTEVRSS